MKKCNLFFFTTWASISTIGQAFTSTCSYANLHSRQKTNPIESSNFRKSGYHPLFASSDENKIEVDFDTVIKSPIALGTISFSYWYLLVFGAAAASNGLPVPDFIPMVPAWPPTDADLVPVVEDSTHFFYISDLQNYIQDGKTGSEDLPQLRLAFFNIAEAWVFSFLPLLLVDKKKLPLPAILFAWFGGLLLTNAFLAPYLLARQIFSEDDDETTSPASAVEEQEGIGMIALKKLFAVITTLVVAYASYETVNTSINAPTEWVDFIELVKNDRTYLAFAVDLSLFTCFQSFLLKDIKSQQNIQQTSGDIPLLGILSWLYR